MLTSIQPFLRFYRNAKGVLSIEFAILIPIMLGLYLGAAEIYLAIDTNRKFRRMTANIGDIVSKLSNTDRADIVDILTLTRMSIAPYRKPRPDVIISALKPQFEGGGTAIVLWNIRKDPNGTFGSPYQNGQLVDLPANIGAIGPELIRIEAKLEYESVLGWGLPSFNMHQSYFVIPRYAQNAAQCNDC